MGIGEVAAVVGIVVGAIVGLTLFTWLVFRVVNAVHVRSRPYRLAVEALERDPRARAALGEPIVASRPLSGRLNYSLLGGRAHFDIPVEGSHATGNLYFKARCFFGPWRFTRLQLGVHHGEILDLREEPS